MNRFSAYLIKKRGTSAVISAALADSQPFYAELNVRARILTAVDTLLRRGTEADLLRTDMDVEVVVLALTGIWHATSGEHEQGQIPKLLDLLVDGLKAPREDQDL